VVPATVKLAATLLVVYGLAVAAQVVLVGLAVGQVDLASLLKETARLVGAMALAWGLLRRSRLAWWLAVAATAALGFLASVSFAVLFGLGGRTGASLTSVGGVLALVVLVCLCGTFVCLVLPQSRRAF